MAGRSPAQQARLDMEKTKINKVRSFADMTPEEREKLVAEVSGVDRETARRRAEAAKRGKR